MAQVPCQTIPAAILLQAAERVDTQLIAKQRKAPIHVKHLLYLVRELRTGKSKDEPVKDLAITAFWGMARLGELTYVPIGNQITRAERLSTTNMVFDGEGALEQTWLTLRQAKTCALGMTQKLQLKAIQNRLCSI